MFKLDVQGICGTCCAKAKEAETLRCNICQFFFHAICDSDSGNTDPIAKKTMLNLFKQASTKPNFGWKCDTCMTISEENQAATLKEVLSKLCKKVEALENKLSTDIKTQVSEEFAKLTSAQSDGFAKLTTAQSEKFSNFSETVPQTVWNNSENVNAIKESLKASLLVKPSENGTPVDANKVRKLVRENGIPVNKVVSTSSGDTFINFPTVKSRDQLKPLIESTGNTVVPLKSKLPTVSIVGLTENINKDEIKKAICNQNPVIGKLVEDGEELSVIYTRPPPTGKTNYQVTVRVSPKIRSSIKSAGESVFLSSSLCKAYDSFHVKRCNKCQMFGHYASKCREDTPSVCGYCGDSHPSDDCLLKSSAKSCHKCTNCLLAGLPDKADAHSTFYYKCPAYIIQQDKLKSAINYDYNLN